MQRTVTRVPLWLGLAVALAALADGAHGQEFERRNEIANRPRPGYDAIGFPVGVWTAYPQLGLETIYTDNVFADDDLEEDDVAGVVLPSLTLSSRTERYRAEFGASAAIARYADYGSEDYDDHRFWAEGQVQAGSVGWIDAEVSHGQFHEDRTSVDDVRGSELTEFSRTSWYLAYTHSPGRLFARVDGRVDLLDYSDTETPLGPVDNDDRDETAIDLGGRLGYAVSPDYVVFGELRLEDSAFDQRRDSEGFERSSFGTEARLGVMLDPNTVISGELYVGYLTREYDDGRYEDTDGPSFGGELVWNLSRLTSITLSADRTIDDTTTVGASGILKSRIGLTVDHELRRNWLLNADVSYLEDDFEDIDRTDEVIRMGVGGYYLMNRYLKLRFGYSFEDRSSSPSSAAGREYGINQIFVRLVAEI